MHLPLAAIIDNVGQLIVVISLIGGLIIGVTIPIAAIYFHHKRQQLWHETARLALEKGQPVPPMAASAAELEHTPPAGVSFQEWQAARKAEARGHQIKGGLVLIAVGAGLYLFFGAAGGGQMRWMGTIPGFIGVALLLHALFESLSARSPTKS